MEKAWIAVCAMLLAFSVFAFAATVATDQSVAYHLKTLNSSIVGQVVSIADPNTLIIKDSPSTTAVKTKAEDKPVAQCAIISGNPCTSDNVTVVNGNSGKVYRVTFDYKNKDELIGKNFKLDFSKDTMDYSVGANQRTISHSVYSFALNGMMKDERYLLFDVNKADGKELDCLDPISWATIKSSFSSWWRSIVSGDILTWVTTVYVPSAAGINNPYVLNVTNQLIFDSETPVTQNCFDESLPSDVTFFDAPTFKIDLLKKEIANGKMTLDFKVKLLVKADGKVYSDYYPK